jgi:hypothetical protein
LPCARVPLILNVPLLLIITLFCIETEPQCVNTPPEFIIIELRAVEPENDLISFELKLNHAIDDIFKVLTFLILKSL